MLTPPEILKAALSIASVTLEDALKYCAPVRARGYHLPEVHAVMHLASALTQLGWHIYPETPLAKEKQRLDLLALCKRDNLCKCDEKGACAILLEAKRIWAPGHAKNVWEDIDKIRGSKLGVYQKLDLQEAWYAALVVTDREGVKDWWMDPAGKESPAKNGTTEARHKNGYDRHRKNWSTLGRYLNHTKDRFAYSCSVGISVEGKKEKKEKKVHLLAAIWKLEVDDDKKFRLLWADQSS